MKQPFYSFNRGRVSTLAAARGDQKRVSLSADTMTNWIPRVLGPMSLRPGWGYIASTDGNNYAVGIPFVFSATQKAIIEFTANKMRVMVDDEFITRPSVSASVTNGGFDTDLTGWTDSDEVGATSAWVAGGYLGLTGDGTASAIRDQTISVAAGEYGTEHGLHIVIERGPVIVKVGSSAGDDDYVTEATLESGEHSFSITPTSNIYVRFMSRLTRQVLVDSCEIESAGAMELATEWTESDIDNIRYDQSGDIIYIACYGIAQKAIERRAERSWSVVRYSTEDGPFRVENLTSTTITPSAINGNITLTASDDIFKSTNVDSLYQITSIGQSVTKSISAENTFSNTIRVTGVGTDRTFTIRISGTFVATITLQVSLESESGPWSDVSGKTWSAGTTETFADGLDNQIAWYRIGVKTGDYTSGTVVESLSIAIGSITGVTRVTGYTSPTAVSAEVITDLGGTDATEYWAEGSWSDRRGFPSAVALHGGRLWWVGKDKIIGSVSDGFYSFDPYYEGDAGPINRSMGQGPVDTANWILPLQRIVVSGQLSEYSVRASSLDEPITPTNFDIRTISTQGSAYVDAAQIDQIGVYVQRAGSKVYQIDFDQKTFDYNSNDLTVIIPEIGSPGIVKLAVQRQPDTRIHAVRSDGTVALGVFDGAEDVLAWIDIETDGFVEGVVVLPGSSAEDDVYYIVKRTINGSTVRYWEKWAQETECRGGTLNKQADSFVTYTGAATTSIQAAHLEGEDVVVWANGVDIGTDTDYTQLYSVSGGVVTLPSAQTNVVVGIPYVAQWKSSRLGQQPESMVEAMMKQKSINKIGLLAAWIHPKGLRYGPDFDTLDGMPNVESGKIINQNTIRDFYAEKPLVFPGRWMVDARLCLQAQAPRPCTVLGASIDGDVG